MADAPMHQTYAPRAADFLLNAESALAGAVKANVDEGAGRPGFTEFMERQLRFAEVSAAVALCEMVDYLSFTLDRIACALEQK